MRPGRWARRLRGPAGCAQGRVVPAGVVLAGVVLASLPASLLMAPVAQAVQAQSDGAPVSVGSRRGGVAPAAAPGQAPLTGPVTGSVGAPVGGLVPAVIESVDPVARRLVVHGQVLALDAGLRVYVAGERGQADAARLRAGQRVRLALGEAGEAAAAGALRRVSLILIDSP